MPARLPAVRGAAPASFVPTGGMGGGAVPYPRLPTPALSSTMIPGAANIGSAPSQSAFYNPAQMYAQQAANAQQAHQQAYSNAVRGTQQIIGANRSSQQAILKGYQGLGQLGKPTLYQQQRGQQQILGGYQQAQRGLAAQFQPALDELGQTYAQQSGMAQQQMINSGLGQTTAAQYAQQAPEQAYRMGVRDIGAAQAGLYRDIGLQRLGAASQFNQQNAMQRNMQTQIGLAGLGYAGQAANQQAQLGLAGIGLQSQFLPPYPQYGAYAGAMGGGQVQNPFSSPTPGFGGGGHLGPQYNQSTPQTNFPDGTGYVRADQGGINGYAYAPGGYGNVGGGGGGMQQSYGGGQSSPSVIYPQQEQDWAGGGGSVDSTEG